MNRVLCENGATRDIESEQVKCPGCGALVVPDYLFFEQYAGILLCRCPAKHCGSFFMQRVFSGWREMIPNRPLREEVFSDIINDISPGFVKIYNESFSAEQMSLKEVCGVGYRKALEFLIKDYVIDGVDNVDAEVIKKMKLSQCIDKYVTDANVKNVSKRAVWLGNDETHYVRKWEEKDVQDLKGLIRLTIRWIEQEKETAKLLAEMPKGR